MEKYHRASKKQLAYIDRLCSELTVINPTLYKKYSVEDAARLIRKLQKQKIAKYAKDRQQKLL